MISLCKKKLGIEITEKDIDAAHRVGPKQKNGKNITRPIIVRSLRRDTKLNVMKVRKLLKNSGIVIVDDLCYEMQQMYNRVKNDELVLTDAWTFNNKIFFKDKGNKVHSIRFGETVFDVINRKRK